MSTDATARKKRWTPAEYLAWERAATEKHELFRGEIFAMAGASAEHNLIVANIVGELRNLLKRGPCRVYPSDMRIKIPATGLYTYADVTAVCGRPEFEDEQVDTLLNPEILVEVLSDSTEGYDRGRKFENYRTIASLTDYVLVAQDRVLVEQYTRLADGSWRLREHRAGGRVQLGMLAEGIAVDEMYLKVFDGGEAGAGSV